tara:strand:- start:2209 stop:3486 length:1278 start_codon:yes stop_codon:yes gene_type:complete
MNDTPHSDEAERGFLGSVLLDSTRLDKNSYLESDWFYETKHQTLFKTLKEMKQQLLTMDAVTIFNYLNDKDMLKKIGGAEYLLELQEGEIIPNHSNHYAAIIREKYILRSEIDIYSDGIRSCYNGESASESIVGRLIGTSEEEEKELSFDDLGEKFIQDCETNNTGHFAWPFDEWTNRLGKVKQDLILISAPRSTGKTAFAIQHMIHAHKNKQRVPFCSIEMLKEELLPRYIAVYGQLNTLMMKTRPSGCTTDESNRAREAMKGLKELELVIRDKSMNISDIKGYCIREWRDKADAFFIDNLLTISDGGKQYQSKTIMYDDFIRNLLDLRNITKVPLFLLCHPNEETLRVSWSKDVENLADQIILLYTVPEEGIRIQNKTIMPRYDIQGTHVVARWQKNRNGESPIASLDFIKEHQTYKHLNWED